MVGLGRIELPASALSVLSRRAPDLRLQSKSKGRGADLCHNDPLVTVDALS